MILHITHSYKKGTFIQKGSTLTHTTRKLVNSDCETFSPRTSEYGIQIPVSYNQNLLQGERDNCVQIYIGVDIPHLAASYSQTGRSAGDKSHRIRASERCCAGYLQSQYGYSDSHRELTTHKVYGTFYKSKGVLCRFKITFYINNYKYCCVFSVLVFKTTHHSLWEFSQITKGFTPI